MPSPTIDFVIPLTVPVKAGDANGALRARAVCCAVETGFSASEVLLTLPSPTIDFVIPLTVPVKAGDASGAFRFKAVCEALRARAVCCAVETGLSASAVLSTLPRPTSTFDNVTTPLRPATDCTGASAAARSAV